MSILDINRLSSVCCAVSIAHTDCISSLTYFSPLFSTNSYSLLSPSAFLFFVRAKGCNLESMPFDVMILETSKLVNRFLAALAFLRDVVLAVHFRIAGNVLGAATDDG